MINANAAGSSRPKRTKKAATPSRSTSSSTTASRPAEVMSNHTPLSAAEQHEILVWLLKGASPLGACQELGIDIARHWLTRQQDDVYRQAIEVIYDTLDQNVISALYRAAMNGNVVAQRHWLSWRSAQCGGPDLTDDDSEEEAHEQYTQLQEEERLATAARSTQERAKATS